MLHHNVVQIAYHVPDIRLAAASMHERFGAGPFFLNENILLETAIHRGESVEFIHSSAFGQWGDVMVELTRQENDASHTPFRDLFKPGESGLHHTAIIVDSFDETVAHFASMGFDLATRCRTRHGGVEFGFIDAIGTLGHMIEIYEGSQSLRGFYAMIREASADWDGKDLFLN